jgi:hypothetical protein
LPIPIVRIVLKFLKSLFGAADAHLPTSPVAYPRPMAEMVEYLVLLQTQGTAPSRGRKGNLLRLGRILSEDAYCLGYLNGMFDALCLQWDVPAAEHRLVTGSACTLLFRDLLDGCCDLRTASVIEDAAFNNTNALGGDQAFLRGKFDGCSELTRYTATKNLKDMPAMLHERLKQLAEAA